LSHASSPVCFSNFVIGSCGFGQDQLGNIALFPYTSCVTGKTSTSNHAWFIGCYGVSLTFWAELASSHDPTNLTSWVGEFTNAHHYTWPEIFHKFKESMFLGRTSVIKEFCQNVVD
jgi:hypothetical protein